MADSTLILSIIAGYKFSSLKDPDTWVRLRWKASGFRAHVDVHAYTHTHTPIWCKNGSNIYAERLKCTTGETHVLAIYPSCKKAKITYCQLNNRQQHDQRPCYCQTGSKFPPPTEWFARGPVSILLLILRQKQTHANTKAVGWKWLKPLIISGPLCQFPLNFKERDVKRNTERELFVLLYLVSASHPNPHTHT